MDRNRGESPQGTACRVAIRAWPDRVEVSLGPGWTSDDLAVVQALPGRRWLPERRVWVAPGARRALQRLEAAFGSDRLDVRHEGGEEPEGVEAPAPVDPLRRVREGLILRGYSPRTRKAYLGHIRRFLTWAEVDIDTLPDDPTPLAERYIVELVEGRRVSRSLHSQVVSALRFLFETVLGKPRLAMALPRPKRNRAYPPCSARTRLRDCSRRRETRSTARC